MLCGSGALNIESAGQGDAAGPVLGGNFSQDGCDGEGHARCTVEFRSDDHCVGEVAVF